MTVTMAALFVHLLAPLLGLGAYARLCKKLREQGAPTVFLIELFLIFFCWGGLLMVILTSLFWQWSGMASLGCAFLLFIAPFLMGGVGIHLARLPQPAAAQRLAMRACFAYFAALVLLLALAAASMS